MFSSSVAVSQYDFGLLQDFHCSFLLTEAFSQFHLFPRCNPSPPLSSPRLQESSFRSIGCNNSDTDFRDDELLMWTLFMLFEWHDVRRKVKSEMKWECEVMMMYCSLVLSRSDHLFWVGSGVSKYFILFSTWKKYFRFALEPFVDSVAEPTGISSFQTLRKMFFNISTLLMTLLVLVYSG